MTKQEVEIKCLRALLDGKTVKCVQWANPWDENYPNLKEVVLNTAQNVRCALNNKHTIKIYGRRTIDTVEDFINEAKKHECFGYIKSKKTGSIYNIDALDSNMIKLPYLSKDFTIEDICNDFLFLDGEPISNGNIEIFNNYN